MTVYLSVSSHLGGNDLIYSALSESEREEVLDNACDIMQDKLADIKYLAEYNHLGKQSFYNDEVGGDKSYATTGWSDHLCDHFVIVLDSGANNFIVYNDKTVSSSKGEFSLFNLLWYGFGPWSANRTPKFPSKEAFAYGERTAKMYKKFHAVGGPLLGVDVRINFYYRYAGKHFYNMTSRKGLSSGLRTKFHQYVDIAMKRSITEALTNYAASEIGEYWNRTEVDTEFDEDYT